MLNTVVCDDELPALDLLTGLLTETGAVSIAGACHSIHDALEIINRGGVDLVVFDIEMPELSGVDAYSKITVAPRPLVIFATAHPEYAVEAFGVEAIDYILKPLTLERVEKAVEKAERLHGLIKAREDGGLVQVPSTAPEDGAGVLKIKDAGKFYFVPHSDILWIEAAGDYSLVHMEAREITIRAPIKSLEAELPAMNFARVHRSAIISTAHIREIIMLPKGEAQICLASGAKVRASRSYSDVVRNLSIAI